MKAAALALALALGAAGPAAAFRPLTPPAPEFPKGAAWLNARGLSLARMRKRKAVVVAFLDPADFHSLRLLPVLESWFHRYALSQLMVVAVLTPDLEIQKDPLWTRTQVERLGIDFPVVLDSDRALWDAYQTRGWPDLFLVDRRGRLVYDHLGEGSYAVFESQIREALGELVDAEDLPPAVNPKEPPSRDCGPVSADIAMGGRAKSAPKDLDRDFALRRLLLTSARAGELATRGKWTLEPDGLSLAQDNARQGAYVRAVYLGAQAMAVLSPPPGGSSRFFVKLDDQWLYDGIQGRDVRFDDDGRSFVTVKSERLYDLVRWADKRPHELAVIPERRGSGVRGFSFADACLATDLP